MIKEYNVKYPELAKGVTRNNYGLAANVAGAVADNPTLARDKKELAEKILKKNALISDLQQDIMYAKIELKEKLPALTALKNNELSKGKELNYLESYIKNNNLEQRFNKAHAFKNSEEAIKSGAYKTKQEFLNDRNAYNLKNNLTLGNDINVQANTDMRQYVNEQKGIYNNYKKSLSDAEKEIQGLNDTIAKGSSIDKMVEELSALAKQLMQ